MTDASVPVPASPAPEGADHTISSAPPVASPEALARAREVFGLDAAPTYAERQATKGIAKDLKPEARRRVAKLVRGHPTPLDFVRKLMGNVPPENWERDLRDISPESTASSFLVFAWKEPPFEPARGRWCLYEAIPAALITTERRLELERPPFWELPKGEREGQALMVSAYQWAMYHQHRLDVRPFWCLQGSEGGTPLHHTPIERRYLRMMGKPSKPLPVGDLPYAPWDGRTRRAVLERDRLAKLGGSVDRLRGTGTSEAQRLAREGAEREYRRVFWDWFGEKLAPQTELYAYVLKHEQPDRIRQSAEDAIAANEARDHFIETGMVPDPVQYRNRRLLIAQ